LLYGVQIVCSGSANTRLNSIGRRWIRTSDFHRLRTTHTREIPCFSAQAMCKFSKNSSEMQMKTDEKTDDNRVAVERSLVDVAFVRMLGDHYENEMLIRGLKCRT
jgi:hypothetical protein